MQVYYSSSNVSFLKWSKEQGDQLNAMLSALPNKPTRLQIALMLAEEGYKIGRTNVDKIINGELQQVRPEVIQCICTNYSLSISELFDAFYR